ncbi:tetratricopeptide repeat protein [Bacteroides intestinalis]|jgi:tetratricopeptide (TPR) repeat protein|uniref:tetratricopeptide repeat protein n=1 Tax=Bacteroides intestinalis TaxID=329854 RepID=UPI0022E819CC|nr:tetratricopeptide repeat protein [Bacteroides intestinalis]
MKIKTLVAVLLLSGGVTSAFAQTEDCNKNSSISHEAVRAGNFKDAYLPWKEVLKACPTLKFYTFNDGIKILSAFLNEIKDRNSADYKKYFDELMEVYDLRMQYTPNFQHLKGTPTVGDTKGSKAISYIAYAPNLDVNQAYAWLKESIEAEKEGSKSPILHYFLDMSLNKLKADPNHKEQFIQDYLTDSEYVDAAIAAENDPAKKQALQQVKDNLVAMFINSGTADCESLQAIYGPKVEANQTDSAYLKKAISVMKMMKCTESEAYFQASYYMYKINPTADAATGCGYMAYKKGDFDTAIKYFDEALSLESDSEKKAQLCYIVAASLFNSKKLSQARSYLQKAIGFKENFGDAYILLAQLYASSPNWNDESALNKCTYFVVIDKLQRAKAVDPSVADKANELISTYARYTPKAEDLFMLGIKAGDRVTIGGWIGESTTVR